MFINENHAKADQLVKKGEFEQALSLLNELLLEHAESPDLLSDIGVVYLHLEKEDECIRSLNQAIELQPDYSYRYACRAFAFNHFKKMELAIQDYEKAVELDPEDAVAHNNLGVLLEQKGYYDQAKKRFEQADRLAKAEDELLGLIDRLESADQKVNSAVGPIVAEKEEDDQDTAGGSWVEFKRLFTSKAQRKEFFNYVRNGFRLK